MHFAAGTHCSVPPLIAISLEVISANIERFEDLHGLAEELVIELFEV